MPFQTELYHVLHNSQCIARWCPAFVDRGFSLLHNHISMIAVKESSYELLSTVSGLGCADRVRHLNGFEVLLQRLVWAQVVVC